MQSILLITNVNITGKPIQSQEGFVFMVKSNYLYLVIVLDIQKIVDGKNEFER